MGRAVTRWGWGLGAGGGGRFAAGALAALAVMAPSALATTRISGRLYSAVSPARPNTKCTISWPSFTAAGDRQVLAGSTELTVTAGLIDVRLEPTDTAVPVFTYELVCRTAGAVVAREYWGVETTESVLTPAQVWRATSQVARGETGPAATLAIGTVTTGAAGSSASVTNVGTSGAAVLDFAIPRGNTGADATVSVGAVTTGAAGSSASVTNAGTSGAAVLDFAIPRGSKGDQGDAATLAIGTVTTGAAGSSASVTNVGTSGAAVFDFAIPRGNTGAAATVGVGAVTTEAAGSSASVTNVGTSGAAVLDFAIPRGNKGDQGDAATLAVGTVTTAAAGSSASVTNVGTSGAAVLDFAIPRGDTGAAATVSVGTVTTGAAGSSASVTNVGTSGAAVLDFAIPRGNTGAGYTASSSTSLAIGTGSTAFTVASGLAYSTGARVRASSAADGSNYMEGLVTSYSSTTLTVNVTTTGGSGTHSDWSINLAGDPGVSAPAGSDGAFQYKSGSTMGGVSTLITEPSLVRIRNIKSTSTPTPSDTSAQFDYTIGELTSNSCCSIHAVNVNATYNGAFANDTFTGVYTILTDNHTAGTQPHSQVYVARYVDTASGGTTTEGFGYYLDSTKSGAGTTTAWYGFGMGGNAVSAGTVTSMWGFRALYPNITSTGAVGTWRGIEAMIPTSNVTGLAKGVAADIGTCSLPATTYLSLCVANGKALYQAPIEVTTTPGTASSAPLTGTQTIALNLNLGAVTNNITATAQRTFLQSNNSGANTVAGLTGLDMTVQSGNSGNVTTLLGAKIQLNAANSGATTITTAKSIEIVAPISNSSATWTNAYGLYINGVKGNGTYTNGPWAIYQAGTTDLNYFAGVFGLAKRSALSTAPGANICALQFEVGTNAGTGKLVAYCGTSTTGATVLDNIGSGF